LLSHEDLKQTKKLEDVYSILMGKLG